MNQTNRRRVVCWLAAKKTFNPTQTQHCANCSFWQGKPGDDTPLGGVGEPGVPVFGPTLAPAIFAAVGKRSRALPQGNQLASA